QRRERYEPESVFIEREIEVSVVFHDQQIMLVGDRDQLVSSLGCQGHARGVLEIRNRVYALYAAPFRVQAVNLLAQVAVHDAAIILAHSYQLGRGGVQRDDSADVAGKLYERSS